MDAEIKRFVKGQQKLPSTQDWLDIKEIKGPVITLKDGQLVSIIEVEPINFNFMTVAEQDHVLQLYQGFLFSLSCPVQQVTLKLPIRMDAYYRQLQEELQAAGEKLQVLIAAQEEWMREVVKSLEILDTRHFIIVHAPGGKKGETGSERVLEERRQAVVGALSNMGLAHHVLNEGEIHDVLAAMMDPPV